MSGRKRRTLNLNLDTSLNTSGNSVASTSAAETSASTAATATQSVAPDAAQQVELPELPSMQAAEVAVAPTQQDLFDTEKEKQ